MSFLRAFGQFWYEFIIGDDWKIAAAVVIALGIVVGALTGKLLGDHLLAVVGAVLVAVCFTISILIDVRPKPNHK